MKALSRITTTPNAAVRSAAPSEPAPEQPGAPAREGDETEHGEHGDVDPEREPDRRSSSNALSAPSSRRSRRGSMPPAGRAIDPTPPGTPCGASLLVIVAVLCDGARIDVRGPEHDDGADHDREDVPRAVARHVGRDDDPAHEDDAVDALLGDEPAPPRAGGRRRLRSRGCVATRIDAIRTVHGQRAMALPSDAKLPRRSYPAGQFMRAADVAASARSSQRGVDLAKQLSGLAAASCRP